MARSASARRGSPSALGLAPHRVRVSGIALGAIRTLIKTVARQSPEAYAQLSTLVSYGRIGEPEDIARAAL